MVHDPDREEEDDEHDGQGRKENEEVPPGAPFPQEIQKAHRLDDKLQDRQNKEEWRFEF